MQYKSRYDSYLTIIYLFWLHPLTLYHLSRCQYKQPPIDPSEINDIDTDDNSDSDIDSGTCSDSDESTGNDDTLPNKNKDISGNSLYIDEFLQCSLSDDESEELDEDEFSLYDKIESQEKKNAKWSRSAKKLTILTNTFVIPQKCRILKYAKYFW